MEFEFILPNEAKKIVDRIDFKKLNLYEFLIEKKILPEIDSKFNDFFNFYSTPREIIQRREIYLKMLDLIKKRKKKP